MDDQSCEMQAPLGIRFARVFAEMQDQIWRDNEVKGFHGLRLNPLYVPTKLALICTEVAEAVEAHRTGKEYDDHLVKANAVGCELADTVIRCMDLAGDLGIDLGSLIDAKLVFNRSRPHKHGGKLY